MSRPQSICYTDARQGNSLLSAETADPVSRLAQLKLSLKDQLNTLTQLDIDIFKLTDWRIDS